MKHNNHHFGTSKKLFGRTPKEVWRQFPGKSKGVEIQQQSEMRHCTSRSGLKREDVKDDALTKRVGVWSALRLKTRGGKIQQHLKKWPTRRRSGPAKSFEVETCHPEVREKKKLAMRAARAEAQEVKLKLIKDKKAAAVVENEPESEQESDDEEYQQVMKRAAELRTLRNERLRAKAVALEEAAALQENELEAGPRIDDEEAASQVLASMLLACQTEIEPPARIERAQFDSPLPPSSPPPASSPEVSPQRHQHKSRAWASPPEWDDPGSPLPQSAYERMPWPRLFKSLFGNLSEKPSVRILFGQELIPAKIRGDRRSVQGKSTNGQAKLATSRISHQHQNGTNLYVLEKSEQSKESENIADKLNMFQAYEHDWMVVNHGDEEHSNEEDKLFEAWG
ncbi:hypothetical protein DFH09DRAFT_1072892 [Mycena vulgaris]|nr:hypothetical protein DFH09DRAFT_1072892 [Mycena vulgaris]